MILAIQTFVNVAVLIAIHLIMRRHWKGITAIQNAHITAIEKLHEDQTEERIKRIQEVNDAFLRQMRAEFGVTKKLVKEKPS